MATLNSLQIDALKDLRSGPLKRTESEEIFSGQTNHHANTIFSLITYRMARYTTDKTTQVEAASEHDVYKLIDLIGKPISYLRKGTLYKNRIVNQIRIRNGKLAMHFEKSRHWVELDYISEM